MELVSLVFQGPSTLAPPRMHVQLGQSWGHRMLRLGSYNPPPPNIHDRVETVDEPSWVHLFFSLLSSITLALLIG